MPLAPLARIPLSGIIGADGTVSIKEVKAPSAFWALIDVLLELGTATGGGVSTFQTRTSAGALFTIQLGIGLPLVYGSGQRTSLGPFLLAPGERATIVITGANPTVAYSGQAIGWQSEDPSDLIALMPLSTTISAPSQLTASPYPPGSESSAGGGGPVVAPAAGQVIFTHTQALPNGGAAELRIYCGYGAVGDQASNMGLYRNGGFVQRMIYPGGNNSAGDQIVFPKFRDSGTVGGDTLSIRAILAGAAGSQYIANMLWTQVPN
jgi:hypothetical protein